MADPNPVLFAFRSNSGIGRDGGALYKIRETNMLSIVYRALPTCQCDCGFDDCELIGTTTQADYFAPYGYGGRESNSVGIGEVKEIRIPGFNCANDREKCINPFFEPRPEYLNRRKRPETPPQVRRYLAEQEQKLAASKPHEMDTS